MNHLTVDEIISFVTASETDADASKVIARVNLHIFKCEECLRQVKAFQVLIDSIEDQCQRADLKKALIQRAKEKNPINLKVNNTK